MSFEGLETLQILERGGTSGRFDTARQVSRDPTDLDWYQIPI